MFVLCGRREAAREQGLVNRGTKCMYDGSLILSDQYPCTKRKTRSAAAPILGDCVNEVLTFGRRAKPSVDED